MMLPFLIPMAIGALGGALTNKKNPLTGALLGGTVGAVTGGLGGLGGAASGAATGAAGATGATASAIPAASVTGTPLGLLGSEVAPGVTTSAISTPSVTGTPLGLLGNAPGGLLSGNYKNMTDMAGLAAKAGLFDSSAPQAQSAGISVRPGDFTGLLTAGKDQMTGAQRLLQQRAARRG